MADDHLDDAGGDVSTASGSELLDTEKLELLSRAVVALDTDGRLTNHGGLQTAAELHPELRSRKRQLFTKEDDSALVEWVTTAEAQGEIRRDRIPSGIFADFTRVNPRHTQYSWMERWRKRLKLQPRPGRQTPTLARPGTPTADMSLASAVDLSSTDDIPPTTSTRRRAGPHTPDRTLPGQQLTTPSTRLVGLSLHSPHRQPRPSRPVAGSLASNDEEDSASIVTSESSVHDVHPNITPGPSELPGARWTKDDSATPPPHFRRLVSANPVGRTTKDKSRASSERTLRTMLEVHNTKDLLTWLLQEWVLDVYHEYAVAELDLMHERRIPVALALDQAALLYGQGASSQKFLVTTAARAVKSGSPRYIEAQTSKAAWTRDDHDVRFIARLVTEGRQEGRWWAQYSHDAEVEKLCAISHRLMAWLHYVHRHTARTSTTAQYQKARSAHWVAQLSQARREWLGKQPPAPPLDPSSSDASDQVNPGLEAAAPLGDRKGSRFGSISSVESFHSANSHLTNDDESEEASAAEQERAAPSPAQPEFHVPRVMKYAVKESKTNVGQAKGLEWMSNSGKARFDAQQTILLASWGVKTSHKDTCVLVPHDWAALEPAHLLGQGLTPDTCPPANADRLKLSMADHQTSWARAAAWFESDSWPRNGAEHDNFMGVGPFSPMEGSHLCHHGTCINPNHIVYEERRINTQRKRCMNFAEDCRLTGPPVPQACIRHDPPCLLQLAALTTFEACLVQLSVLRQAKGIPAAPPLPKPDGHSFETFEVELPLSFDGRQAVVQVENLVDNSSAPVPPAVQGPMFQCSFCARFKSYKSVVFYWGHVRDFHDLHDKQVRLDAIREAGRIWKDHLLDSQSRGASVSEHGPTGLKLEQLFQPDFTWETLMTWKLFYRHER